ncbi:MAG: VacJ family lipoprotein [Pseudomonadota bacterium]
MSTTFIKLLLSVIVCSLGLGCASTSSVKSQADPYESLNRSIYGFNNGLDTYLIKPVSQGYRVITPEFMEAGVSNVFANLLEVRSLLNAGLQAKGSKSLHYSGRLFINTTVGLFGLLDIAQYLGLEKIDGEDFGQTLGVWGVRSGPYLVLPFLGPSTIRDTAALPVNSYAYPLSYVDHVSTRNSLTAAQIVDTRAGLLDSEKLLTGDRYIFIRDAFLQRREFLVNDGIVEDNFGESLDEDDDF